LKLVLGGNVKNSEVVIRIEESIIEINMNKHNKRSPLLVRRFPWALAGALIVIFLLLYVPRVSDCFYSLKLQTNDKELSSEETVQLLEKAVLSEGNKQREKEGLPPVIWNDELYIFAKAHSINMAQLRDMFHSDVGELYAENCIFGFISTLDEPEEFINSWLDSNTGHAKIILSPNIKHVAVGISDNGNYRYATWTFWRDETTWEDYFIVPVPVNQ